MSLKQSTNSLIMIRPAHFCFNTETAVSNGFQNVDYTNSQVQQQALKEFDEMVDELRSENIHVNVFDDTSEPIKPDAIFPNNWFTTHPNGTIILYPMLAINRRLERRTDIFESLAENFQVKNLIDLSSYEQTNEFLEGTGSMVFDHLNKRIFAVRSTRTNEKIVRHVAELLNYKSPPILFDSCDDKHQPIYHTNVMMSIGTFIAIICLESIVNHEQRNEIIKLLENNQQRKLINITLEQMKNFAGNMLEIITGQDESIYVMSKTAYQCLTVEQRNIFEQANIRLRFFDTTTIEQCGGGSVRCMIAENFLPRYPSNGNV